MSSFVKTILNKLDRIKSQDIVEVIFDDPTQYDTNYESACEPVECVAIGWLEKKTPRVITIAWLKEIRDEPYVGFSIPIGCVKSIRTLVSGSKKRRLGQP